MSAAFVLLVHENFARVAELTKALVAAGGVVAIHVDARVPEADLVALGQAVSSPKVVFTPRRACEWGAFSLVEAALAGAETALAKWPEAGHVCLLSGSCLPVKPLADFFAHLDASPESDFVESVPATPDSWVKSGLSDERFTLHFPFSWQRQRWLFDRFVTLQRKLGIKRRLPEGIEPHLGAQWWCLSRATLEAILADPMRATYDRYFRSTWIPDESYFATLARKHSRNLVSKPVTFHRFDAAGRPFVFYDDHAEYLAGLDAFFARKIWRGADGLYRRFLGGEPVAPRPGLSALLDAADRRGAEGRDGLLMAGRFPHRARHRQYVTTLPYAVFVDFARQFPGLPDWIGATEEAICHGELYHPDRAALAGGEQSAPGGLTDRAEMRDYDQVQFLMNLIRSRPDCFQAFLLGAEDGEWMLPFIAGDKNAAVFLLSGGWQFEAWRLRQSGESLTEAAIARLRAAEATRAAPLLSGPVSCVLHQLTLREVLLTPERLAGLVIRETPFVPGGPLEPALLPEGFLDFLEDLETGRI